VVGWYHSHPGFGCWLSSVDISTQQSFEQLNTRSVAVVVDPIQSVRGKVVIDAFRTIPQDAMMSGREPRQTTANIGHLKKPTIQAIIHGLDRSYYSMPITYRKGELEQKMLLSLHRKQWTEGMRLEKFDDHRSKNGEMLRSMLELAKNYHKTIQEESEESREKLVVKKAGRLDPKRHLEHEIEETMTRNIVQCLGTMLDTEIF
jgi:26S proteasome regulatory subunit N11